MCSNLFFAILSISSYLEIESINIIYSDVDMNEYKLLGPKSKQSQCFKTIRNSALFRIFKQSKKDGKLKSNDTENELSKYIESNIAKLRYIIIKNYKNNFEPLREF